MFDRDKSQIVRGLAIIFMICLHNHCGGLFRICIPLFTFLVGYGYGFAKKKNLNYGIKRIWNLLSHFWLILIGIFLPIALVDGEYDFNIKEFIYELFGLESELNWYSWYVYFYIFAMIVMPLIARIIDRYKLIAAFGLIVFIQSPCILIHMYYGWADDIWLKAAFDCCLCSPAMIAGYYCSSFKIFGKVHFSSGWPTATIAIGIAVAAFFARTLPFAYLYDFVLTTIFILAVAVAFQAVNANIIQIAIIALGQQSMNMWFIHALFFTTATASATAFLVDWAQPKIIHIIWMILLSYLISLVVNKVYFFLCGLKNV